MTEFGRIAELLPDTEIQRQEERLRSMRRTDDEYQALVCKTISNKAKSVASTSYSSFVTEPPGTVLSAVGDRDDARGMYQLYLDHLHK